MGLDLELWTVWDLRLKEPLRCDRIVLNRDASWYAFTDEGNEEGLVIPTRLLEKPICIENPDPSCPSGLRTITGITHDRYGQPLTYVPHDAFKALKSDDKHNECAYRLMENHTYRLPVVLWWC